MTVKHKNPKIGRNEPCPCGSGKKYKKCCYRKSKRGNAFDNGPPIKISEAILKISEPLMTKYPQSGRITVLIDLAIAAWNISLASGDTRENIENRIVELMPEQLDAVDVAVIVEQMDMLVERKNKLYSHIRYFIVSHNLSFDDDGQLTLDIDSAPIAEHDIRGKPKQ